MHSDQPPPPTTDDSVIIRRERWRVDRVQNHADVIRLDVSNRRRRATFLVPFDRARASAPRERLHRVRPRVVVARLSRLLAGSHRARHAIQSAAAARMAILPHQFEPALALASGVRRVLVADEVGLGKTIQAGLAIAECVRRRPGARVLVIAPTSLHAQWQTELLERLGLTAAQGDRAGLDAEMHNGAFGDNPWALQSIWIASLDFLKQPHVLDGLPHSLWDLMVVDEAHEACGDSARHRAGAALARRARAVMLLTATPHSGDATRFARLTSFGALDGADDPVTIFRRTRRQLGAIVARRVRWRRVAPSLQEAAALDALLAFERRVLHAASGQRIDDAALLLSVLRKRALSTMAAFAISIERRLEWVERRNGQAPSWLQPSLQFDEGASDGWQDRDLAAMCVDVGLSPALERTWLRRLRDFAVRAARQERKIAHLVALTERSREPVVAFTEFRDSLTAVVRQLGPWRPVASIHGGMPESEQRRARERFLRGEASVLVATDVASQGLNLQDRARWVVGLELPWNPCRLEQRAGRVDRIGQRRPVHVTWLTTAHAAGHRIEQVFRDRVRRARGVIGEDALEMTVPSERAICADIILGAAVPAAPESIGSPPISKKWARLARKAAGRESRVRELQTRWRGSIAPARVEWCRLGRRRRAWRVALIFTSAIHDANGEAIESTLACFTWNPTDAVIVAVPRVVVDHARRGAALVAARRARRLGRRLGRAVGGRIARERALVAALVDDIGTGAVQPGLFDRRAVQRAGQAQQIVAAVQCDADAECDAIARSAALSASTPRLALVLFA
ncbi:MAG TPA: helicase-related protein [Vicinamibacterales bacterium]|nr:helicase-related protein [Vicinamibacterales bacterium]